MAKSKSNAPKINGAIRLEQKKYVAGQEKDLLAASTEEQRKAWLKRGLIEGDWGVEEEEEAPIPVAVSDDDLESIAARISASLSVERDSEETPLQFLNRFADDCEKIAESMEMRLDQAESERDAAQQELAALKANGGDAGANSGSNVGTSGASTGASGGASSTPAPGANAAPVMGDGKAEADKAKANPDAKADAKPK